MKTATPRSETESDVDETRRLGYFSLLAGSHSASRH